MNPLSHLRRSSVGQVSLVFAFVLCLGWLLSIKLATETRAYTDIKTGTVSSVGQDTGTGPAPATKAEVEAFLNPKNNTVQDVLDIYNAFGWGTCNLFMPMSCPNNPICYTGAYYIPSGVVSEAQGNLNKNTEEFLNETSPQCNNYGGFETCTDEIGNFRGAAKAIGLLHWEGGNKWCSYFDTGGCGVWMTSCVEFTKSGDLNLSCKHEDTYNYRFQYDINQGGNWVHVGDTTPHKCEAVKVTFSPEGDFGAVLEKNSGGDGDWQLNRYAWISGGGHIPPANNLSCSDQASCFNQATEYQLTTETWGKGVQKQPAGFVDTTQNSLSLLNNGTSQPVQCSGGQCTAFGSGQITLGTTAPASSYLGQCRGYDKTINNPEVAIPAVTSTASLNITNRPPGAAVSIAKEQIYSNEETDLTCTITDPDNCVDKIAKVRWICRDSNGSPTNCQLWGANTGQWNTGEFTQNLVGSEQTNPFVATAKFRASVAGTYSITCEGTDNDSNGSATGTGTVTRNITVVEKCDDDGVCNEKCPYDPDCCEDPYCLPYCPGYGYPHCVIPAGSCVVIRTKPGMDIDAVKPLDEVGYQAAVNGGGNPLGYTWYCDKNGGVSATHSSEKRTDDQICKYENEGIFEPKASYQYNDGHGNVRSGECVNAQGVGIEVSKGAEPLTRCSITVDKSETGRGDSITARISPVPEDVRLKGVSVTWTANGKTQILNGSEGFSTSFDKAGQNKIEAIVKNFDKSKVPCSSISIDVSDTVRWSN